MKHVLQCVFTSLTIVTLAAMGGVWFLQGQLAIRPPVAIIDYGPIANALALGVAPKDIQPILQETKRRAAAYEDAGYVVINSASIDAAPVDVFIPAVSGIPEAWLNTAESPATDVDLELDPSANREHP